MKGSIRKYKFARCRQRVTENILGDTWKRHQHQQEPRRINMSQKGRTARRALVFITFITKYYHLVVLDNTHLLPYSSVGQEFDSFRRANVKVSAGQAVSWRLQGRFCLLVFFWFLETAYILWLWTHHPSTAATLSLCGLFFTSDSLSFIVSLLLYRILVITLGPGNVIYFMSSDQCLNYTRKLSSPFPCNLTYSQFWELGHRHFGEGYYSFYHREAFSRDNRKSEFP